MPHLVKVNQENQPPGAAVFIAHLGTFVNGEVRVLKDEVVEVFETLTGRSLKEALAKAPGVQVVEVPPEALKDIPEQSAEQPSEEVAAPKSKGGKTSG